MNVVKQLDRWHQTKTGLLVFGLVELALAYVFSSWAIDSGSLLAWFLTIVFFIGAIQNFIKVMLEVVHITSRQKG